MRTSSIAPNRIILLLLAISPLIVTSACGGDPEVSGVTVSEELRGDTVVMVSSGELERVRVEEPDIFWRSDALELSSWQMRQMAAVGDHLVIGDGQRVHLLSMLNGGVRSFGGAGEGPGEFGFITRVGEFGPDTIGVYDFGLQRISLFSLEGDLLRSHRVSHRPEFPGPAFDVHPLVRSGAGVLRTMTNFTSGPGVRLKALLWHDLEADTSSALDVRPWVVHGAAASPVAPRPKDAFPDRVVYSINSRGGVARGDPASYCIRLFQVFEEGVRMVCRERSRIPVSQGFNAPDFDLLDNPGDREFLNALAQYVNPAEYLPHFDRLLFSEAGDLWVRTYHEELADTHPLLLDRLWELHPLQPTVREWDVFDSEGVLVRQLAIPKGFDLRVVGNGEAFGFLTLETGEVAIGRVDLSERDRANNPG